MRQVFKPNANKLFLSVVTAALLSSSMYADCTYELFNIASVKGTSVGEFIDQISDECGISVVIADAEAENILKKQMNKTYLKNLTLNEVLDLIVSENDLQYTLQNNVLKISYLTTKTYQLDYIATGRKGSGSTNIRLSSNSGASSTSSSSGTSSTSNTSSSGSNGGSSESGTNIVTIDEVTFWDNLEKEVKNLLSRPEDQYQSTKKLTNTDNKDKSDTNEDNHAIYINKHAGLVTVTGTGRQIKRLDAYIDDLQKKMQSQVMIDVKMYSVVFNDGSTTGIDWSQIYKLQNFEVGFNKINFQNVDTFTGNKITTATTGDSVEGPRTSGTLASPTIQWAPLAGVREAVNTTSKMFTLSNSISINNLLMFLKTQGDVYSISNPKIMTLNNQPALITAGTELFYKTVSSSTLAGGSTGTTSQNEVISSVFSGVLLDITPEIAKDGSITLRINPSVSDVASTLSTDNSTRTMPPDLSRRQISSVVTVKDGSRVVLGGLINRKTSNSTTKVPFLGDIPVVGYLFKQDGVSEKVEELVIVIEPHIIKKDGSNIGLSDLGYSRLTPAMENDRLKQNEQIKTDATKTKDMKENVK
ncbi:MAG: pilus (MSHA type) biogenesis protein MshL [Sulfuricurvum sp.]|uniref:pilus (MSHA type) biogenesis protein MshL n=1 Tax=Sulfuricurvum sp. TaxID=2025608 RepID=UPI00260A0B85|nr:pilus (MSHA type) biogenesis protein MshL [Sulfuricurvum sp.]MDD2828913.1 pilus (MSHA type) biogenesis protein MshL [Sulfuricurvum sp.]MDD4948576.1 pilus (MSHA type) biogenesis protein MshL [Sulfuricurvum sp.]